jgi:asparagine synthase (glutamine-hydrolysing)
MCGISGHFSNPIDRELKRRMVKAMTDRIAHRGPDGEGIWISNDGRIGLGHRRLSIIDLETGSQPMVAADGNALVFNGEIYNYKELRQELQDYPYQTQSDTEVILAGYKKWGVGVVDRLRGMFAFVLYDAKSGDLFCARDPLGIKPFYYATTKSGLVFGSEVKALLPHLDRIAPEHRALKEYFVFQLQMGDRTLFEGVKQLEAGHSLLLAKDGSHKLHRYWKPEYKPSSANASQVVEELRSVLKESVHLHTRADVPIGAYVSGGVDSSFVCAMAKEGHEHEMVGFTGRFDGFDGRFDESQYARDVGAKLGIKIYERTITADDFKNTFAKLVYHMDYPEAGPGSFPQYCVSELASQHRKVVLGGQGGDEVFGGYARYMVALLENALGASIDGRSTVPGNLSLADIHGNLTVLKQYRPMMQGLMSEGIFGPIDQRYFKLVSRAPELSKIVDLDALDSEKPFDRFREILVRSGASSESPMTVMTGFDLVSLLPGLLHVEDRVSMAWGLESRVPIVDRNVFEFAARVPENIKLPKGELKGLLRSAVAPYLPSSIMDRKDKMGFPTPLNLWMKKDLGNFIREIFLVGAERKRGFYDPSDLLKHMEGEGDYSRNIWGLMNIEMWMQTFVDRASEYRFQA